MLPYEVIEHSIDSGEYSVDDWLNIDGHQDIEATRNEWCARMGVGNAKDLIPMGMWGDSAPYSSHDSLSLLLWSTLGHLRMLRHWFVAFGKRQACQCGCRGTHTYDRVFQIFVWAMRAHMSGRWPTTRDDGTPFAASHRIGDQARAQRTGRLRTRGFVCQVRGDWEWFVQALGLTSWRNPSGDSNICWQCDATGTNFLDASLTAPWRPTCMNHACWLERQLSRNLRVAGLFALPGFLMKYVVVDWMHTVDLGIAQYLLGNILLELLMLMGGTQSSPEPEISQLLLLIKQMSKQLGCKNPPFHGLTIGMIKRSGANPHLRTKAAETRHAVPCVLRLLDQYFPPRDHRETTRVNCLRWLNNIYVEMEQWDASSPAKIAHAARCHLALYYELYVWGVDNMVALGHQAYRMYPKHHTFLHLCESGENPRDAWNYRDESSIGDAVKVAESCHTNYVHRAVLQKRRLDTVGAS